MHLVTLLNLYICSNVLLVLAAAGSAALRWAQRRKLLRASQRRHLQAVHALTLAALLLPLAMRPDARGLQPDSPGWAQIWSGPSMREPASATSQPHLVVTLAAAELALPLDAPRLLTLLLASGALVFAALLLLEARRLRGIIRNAHRIARRGSLRVLASDAADVPFALWVPGRHFIVVPTELLALRCADLRVAIQHEGQHHRQLDTKLVHVYQLLRVLCWVNPAVHWLTRCSAQLQELACDEALIQQRRIGLRTYCGCLLRLAESALSRRRAALSLSMLGGGEPRSTLRGRIEALLAAPAGQARSFGIAACCVGLLVVMLATTVVAAAAVQDRRISLPQAQAMASAARVGSDFPITVNARVLQQLNRLLGTPDGRAFVRASLQRMAEHRALIVTKAAQYGLPEELLAVPLAESGFRNLAPGKDPRHGAGIWMFIEPTARRFGLTVNATLDQRLDVAGETDAAMRLLSQLQQQFSDWELALLAYNAGSAKVQRGIEATGARDAWQIIAQGYENDPDYVAAVMAMVLILRNPGAAE